MEVILFTVNIIATIAFAISGVLVAARHKLDWIGFVFITCITGIGGRNLASCYIRFASF
ncbi:TRIC cation channel family protein [Aliiglaciecola lipolytica]|uniref:TRIC cation channel family protein n=1 Tax=Aliiglaciecola lipolytica TaxID=477689 RepID=UPI001D0569F4|nr:TRIC cation channel family protein [Aliiglaciecola lipolytica]